MMKEKESDEDNVALYPDDDSAGSNASDFELLANNTDEVLGCRFLVAKQEDEGQAQPNDYRDRGILEKRHRIIFQQYP